MRAASMKRGAGAEGDTSPRTIPVPGNTNFTVTLINNEEWVRTADITIDATVNSLDVPANSAVTKQFTSGSGEVTFSIKDSQYGLMKMPVDIALTPLGESGGVASFGTEKPVNELRSGYMDVFVHVAWDTVINT